METSRDGAASSAPRRLGAFESLRESASRTTTTTTTTIATLRAMSRSDASTSERLEGARGLGKVFSRCRCDAETWLALLASVERAPKESSAVLKTASPNARVGEGMRDWILSVGDALMRAAKGSEERTRELFGMIDERLDGGAGERVVGLTLLDAALGSEACSMTNDDIVLAVHKALTSVSTAPVENGFACASVGMRAVCAAARHLRVDDVRTLRTAWLEPRLNAQGFTWSDSDNVRSTLSLIEYLKIPRDERLGATTMSAFLMADLELVGYVDGEEFKRKVIHGAVDLDSADFQALDGSERSVGKTVAAAVIATQMNLMHALYVAPGLEVGADDLQVRVARESGRILCGKSIELLRIERENAAKRAENAQVKVEELTADVNSSTILGVLNHALTAESMKIEESERAEVVLWCCDKLSETFVSASDDSVRDTISSGCASALLRLAESSEEVAISEACMRCVLALMDLITVKDTLYDFVEVIALKTPSLDLLGIENKLEMDRRAAFVVAALNWTVSRVRATATISQAENTLALFKRLFELLSDSEQGTWLEHFTDVYAAAALWVGQIEKDVSVDTDRVLADAAAQNCVESFDDASTGEQLKKRPEWLKNLQIRARWLKEAFAVLDRDSTLCACFLTDLVAIVSKSVETWTHGSVDALKNANFWPYQSKNRFITPRIALGPGGVLAVSATTFELFVELLERLLESRGSPNDDEIETCMNEYIGLVFMLTRTVSASTAAGIAIKTPGGTSAGRVALGAARALFSVAKCLTQVNFAVRSSDAVSKTFDRDLIAQVKSLLAVSNEVEQSKTLDAAPGAHRRFFAASRAALVRAISLTEPDNEDIKFELDKIRKRHHSKRWTEKHAKVEKRVVRPSAASFASREAQPDDFIDEDGVSILEAFEPSTDEETDSEDEENDDEAFVVRGMTDCE
ncbi:unnamed product [Ostreococcus tauri]|uniref:Unnamed product n=1 Tax=Ostreococcus tauri TaxID=70448 RepID=A0A090M8H8_OSTTA|nr:unnamed product [Ostreococcus tauri]CEF99012.1 unnamed product [Ostreococcus tauri]|eukprot:XP_022839601.1 unnamed product [Ostreococcus tauri]